MNSEEAAAGRRVVGLIERGTRNVVAHLGDLDELIVLDDDGVWSLEPAELMSTLAGGALDPLTPVYRVTELPRGVAIGGPQDAVDWRLNATVLTAALLLGIAEEGTARATTYVMDRQQFGRPVGSFQAVKHLLADMVVRAELARGATYAAAAVLDDPATGNSVTAASTAKLLAGRAAFLNSKTYVQAMGGMGITWEMPAHLYLKRSLVLEGQFGDAATHEARLAAGL